jgi:hypothetical protein
MTIPLWAAHWGSMSTINSYVQRLLTRPCGTVSRFSPHISRRRAFRRLLAPPDSPWRVWRDSASAAAICNSRAP